MQKDGFIVEVTDGFIRVYFANDGMKDGLFIEASDASIIKSELKVITTAPSHISEPSGTAQFTAIGGSCSQTPVTV